MARIVDNDGVNDALHAPEPRATPIYSWIAIALLVAAAGLFIAGRWIDIPRFLPFLLIALCPLLHLFHGYVYGGEREKDDRRR